MTADIRLPQTIEHLPVEQLVPYARNARTHSESQVDQIAAAIREFGWTNPVLIDAAGGIIAGHGRVLAAQKLGIALIPCIRLTHLTDAQRRALILADNKLALNAGWDEQLLAEELLALSEEGFDLDIAGFGEKEINALLKEAMQTDAPRNNDNKIPEPPQIPVTRAGDLWLLDKHRLICGDCIQPEIAQRLFAGISIDLILIDPPYCSGGFKEVGRAAGSVGSQAEHKHIANDRLSTRGYMALLKSAIYNVDAKFIYCFTDWRMWVYLFDVVESSGFGVRSMIVWDKGTPGMGRGWRAQHELIMFGTKSVPPFDKHDGGAGNVIAAPRTGNLLHTTEKPVAVMERLLEVTPFAMTVADIFTGSGTVLIACERLGRRYFGAEIDPSYVDVVIDRWQQYTGGVAVLEGDGRTFAEIEAERRGE